jgi:sec-independent protein translocase protein TatB
MFGLGMGEIVIILVLALILLGPQKLPDAAKQLGKGLREFRKATDDLKSQFEGELYADDRPRKPKLVEPAGEAGGAAAEAASAPVPAASADNVPGLEAALVEAPPAPAAPAPVPAANPAIAEPASKAS